MAAYPDELFSLTITFCTIKDVHALLKRVEDRDGVKLTAPNLSTLVNKNLRDALDAKAIEVNEVYNLIREAEENGHQHLYYYRPVSKEVRALPLVTVGNRLFGVGWEDKMKFPRFALKANDFVYADLRQWNSTKKPQDWVLKIYGEQFFEEQQGGDERLDELTVRRTFVLQPKRLVLMVRFNSPDLLEVRVPQSTSRDRVSRWLDQAWEMMQKVFRSDEFTPWDLDSARRSLVFRQHEFTKLYRFSHSRLEDEAHNKISISSAHAERSLESSTQVVKSMRDLVKPGIGECRYLRVTWLPTKDQVPADELVSYLGDRNVNEIAISRGCSAREVDYVTEQLRYFSKPATGV